MAPFSTLNILILDRSCFRAGWWTWWMIPRWSQSHRDCSLHSSMFSTHVSDTGPAWKAWETDLDLKFSKEYLKRQETTCKLCSRWYMTPLIFQKLFPPYLKNAGPVIKPKAFFLIYMVTLPPLISLWTPVQYTTTSVLGNALVLGNAIYFILAQKSPIPMKHHSKFLTMHMINAARQWTPIQWCPPPSQSKKEWYIRLKKILQNCRYRRAHLYCTKPPTKTYPYPSMLDILQVNWCLQPYNVIWCII